MREKDTSVLFLKKKKINLAALGLSFIYVAS